MRIAFVVNDVRTERAGYTTTHLAMAATNLGHEVWYVSVADLALDPGDRVGAWAHSAIPGRHRSSKAFLHAVTDKHGRVERIMLDELDVLMLRNNPAEDVNRRPWARLAAVNFARFAVRRGVIVLNDPKGLATALTKLYLHCFPESIRPQSLVSRNPSDIKSFVRDQGGYAVLKPLSGSGGRNVFLLQPTDAPNINQMIAAVSEDGYVIAQEYLHSASRGDTRLFLMNGEPLRYRDRIAAIHRARLPGDADMRSNISAGAVSHRAELDDAAMNIAELVRPRLIEDGLFFVGLDIAGAKLMEINVFSPGGLENAQTLEGAPFLRVVIHAIERKVERVRSLAGRFDNAEIAVF